MSRPANPVLLAGLRGINSRIRERVTAEIGLLAPLSQDFWKTLARGMDLAARRMVEARLEREDVAGAGDAAFAEFMTDVGREVERLGIANVQEVRLTRLVRQTARCGLAGLVPAVTEYLSNKAKEEET